MIKRWLLRKRPKTLKLKIYGRTARAKFRVVSGELLADDIFDWDDE